MGDENMRARALFDDAIRLLACRGRRIVGNEDGATAIEYAIIAAGIAVVIITATSVVGVNLAELFEKVAEGFGGKCC
jgi:pilus assembly protein Flp/PilA